MTDAPAIYPALAAIQSDLGRFEKTGRGPSSQGSYPFIPTDDIVARLNPLMVTHGVVLIPRQTSCEQQTYRFPKVNMDGQPVHDGKADAVQLITRLSYDFVFVATEDGSSVTASAYGESIDSGDKGVRRAATAAFKEMVLRTFMIAAGDEDPDGRHHEDDAPAVVRQDRGAQAREKAAGGARQRGERAPRAARGTVTETAEEKAAVEETPAATVEAAAPADAPATVQESAPSSGDAAEAQPTAAERRAAAIAARRKPAAPVEEPKAEESAATPTAGLRR